MHFETNPGISSAYTLIASETIKNVTCSDTASAYVKVNPLPEITLNPLPEKCENDSMPIFLKYYVYPAGGIWSTSDSGLISNDSVIPSLAGAGMYHLYYEIVDSINGCINIDTVVLVINQLPGISITIQGDTLIAVTGMIEYQWYKNGDTISGAVNNHFIMTTDGSYSVSVKDSNGCIAISDPYIREGIKEMKNDMCYNIYPNPNNGEFILEFKNPVTDVESITIMNALGVEIKPFLMNQGFKTKSIIINLKDYPKGIYIISVNGSSGFKGISRIVVK